MGIGIQGLQRHQAAGFCAMCSWKLRLPLGIATLLWLGCVTCWAARPEFVPGEVVVKYRSGMHSARSGGLREEVIGRGGGLRRVRLSAAEGVEHALQRLRHDPDVEYVEPNYVIRAEKTVVPDDPYYAEGVLWSLEYIEAPRAWDLAAGGAGVVVAVIDSGVDPNHPDLAPNIWRNGAEVANGLDDDGNGYVDDAQGYNFVDRNPVVFDVTGHGSAVAGVIGAAGNNGEGSVGVSWSVELMPLRVLGPDSTGNVADAVEAILYAVNQGAQVINMSWGTTGDSRALRDALLQAADHGVLVVASAGNSGLDTDTSGHYPSGWDLPNMVSVAATEYRSSALRADSNWGPSTVHVAAPGTLILSTCNGGGYACYSGTSFAAAMVSGLAALTLSVPAYQNIGLAELRSRITDSATRVAELDGKVSSGGVIDAYEALSILAPYRATLRARESIRFHAPRGNEEYDWTIDGPQLGSIVEGVFRAAKAGSCRIRAVLHGEGDAEDLLSGAIEIVAEDTPPDSPGSAPETDGGGGGCFVAPAAYGSPLAPQVRYLRIFRDRWLLQSSPGRFLARAYYTYSPAAARFIAEDERLRLAARAGLYPVVGVCRLLSGEGRVWLLIVLGGAAGLAVCYPRLCAVFRVRPTAWGPGGPRGRGAPAGGAADPRRVFARRLF
ncbi:MAG: S8 family peptidase [Pseudomonadota bacterium]